MKLRTFALHGPVLAALALAACSDSTTTDTTPGDSAADIATDLGADTAAPDVTQDLGTPDTTVAKDTPAPDVAPDVTAVDAGDDASDATVVTDVPKTPDAADAGCPSGQTSCGEGSAAACVTLASDARNCGSCGNACATGQSCASGACVCPTGLTLCGGACIDTNLSVAHCGACGNACPAMQMCSAGRCALTCTAPASVCGTGTEMFCADFATSRDNCGGCGRACTTPIGATTATCTAGACVPMCSEPLADCDGMFANGCETNTATSLANCGACGRLCPSTAPMASSVVCTTGACRPVCTTGQADCDGTVTNGCEATLATSVAHCGACGNACAAGAACEAGVCLARSCREAHTRAPTAPSGIFHLDPDGTGVGAPIDVYCDMTTEGGGWTLLATFYNSGPTDTRRWISDEIFTNAVTMGTLAARDTDDFKSPAYTQVAGSDMLVMTDEYHFGFNDLLGARSFGDYVASQVSATCSSTWTRSGVDFSSDNLTIEQQRMLSFTLRGLDVNGGGAMGGCAVHGSNENAYISFTSGPSWWVFGAGNCVACAGGWTTYDNGMLNLATLTPGACTADTWPCNHNGLWWSSTVYPSGADTKTRYLQILVR